MLKRNKLALSISAAVLGGSLVAPLAVAQEAALEEITVTGIRASLQDAQSVKRNSVSIVDAISAEDVGKFPDKNVAESLARITGVGVTRDFGQGEKVTIRGAGADYNRTTLNGQTVATADWFILDNPARSFNFTLLPSTLIKTLEVHKSPEASQDEGSLGGTVVVRTHRPLDLDANQASIAVESTYTETSESWDPTVSGQYSWKNEAETFGVLVAGNYLKRDQQRNGFEVLGWSDDSTDGILYPTLMGTPTFQQSRERETYFVSAQFRPSEELTLTLDALNSSVDADNMNANWMILTDDIVDQIENGTATITGDTATAVANGSGTALVDFINRRSSTETESYTLTAEYETDAFSLSGVVGHTEAAGGTYRETSWEYVAAGAAYSYDLGAQSYSTNPGPTEADAYAAGWIWGGSKPTTDEETYIQLDLDIPVEIGALTAIKTGVKFRDGERTQDRNVYSWHGPETLAGNEDLAEWPVYLGYIFEQCPTLANCGLDSKGIVSVDSPINGNGKVLGQARDVMEAIAFNGLNGVPADLALSKFLPEIWAVAEETTSFYVQADFESGALRGNAGLRYVTTDQTSSGYTYLGDGYETVDRVWLSNEGVEWVTVDNDYSEVLPSLNLAYDLNDEMVVRGSVARVMARQNWDRLSGYSTFGSLNVADPKGAAGNPNLMPTFANQFDIGYEWYYGDASAFSTTFFYKDIDSYIENSYYTEPRYNEMADEYVDVDFAAPINGEGGEVTGIELAVDHGFDNGFGLSANYTFTDVTNEQGAIGISENMVNLQGYFENDTFSGRLMYNYRDDYNNGFSFNGFPLWTKGFGQVDASLAYNFSENASFTFEAVNLTDEEVEQVSGEDYRLTSLYQNGRRFVVGARYKF